MKLLLPLLAATSIVLSVVNCLPTLTERQASGTRFATAEEEATQRYYMTLAGNAYCETVIPGGKWDCPNCNRTAHMTIVKTFKTSTFDTNAMVVRDDDLKRIIGVFRGSVSAKNFQADIDQVFTRYPIAGGLAYVHRGFYQSYNEVADEIIAVIDAQLKQYPDYFLATTGHSLGGTTSLLCALDLQNRGYKVSEYSAGSPRVGNRAFAQYVINSGLPYTRLTNKKDIFVDYPYQITGYVHAGEEFWIRSDNRIQVCRNGLETDDCLMSTFGLKNVDDHLNYWDLSSSGECPVLED
ncbi:catalysis At the Interface: the anatomy of A conformational change in A triglyceride lipase [Fennellomyces sp. T-0311]|nr:catalysis At the Interface: the anatomy of A conformational change in A triglyceride lipase [Fennellomyces sp. T-0311]